MHTLLGRKASPESADVWEESRFEVEGTGEDSQSWASENFLYFFNFSNFLFTAAAVMVSLYSRKSRSSLLMKLEVCICFRVISITLNRVNVSSFQLKNRRRSL